MTTITITRRAATDTTWKDYGTCASIGPLDPLWFPEKNSGSDPTTVRRVCRSCLVQYECLTTALATPHTQDHGWWAGTSETDRHRLRRDDGLTDRTRPAWTVAHTPTHEQADAARRHHNDGRSIEWISYALHLTAPAVHSAVTTTKSRETAA